MSVNDHFSGAGGGTVMDREKEKQLDKQKTPKPPMKKVVGLNDDFTPMEFVVGVLQKHFNKDRETATNIMLQVHREGQAVFGTYTPDVAQTKRDRAMEQAQAAGHPFQLKIENA